MILLSLHGVDQKQLHMSTHPITVTITSNMDGTKPLHIEVDTYPSFTLSFDEFSDRNAFAPDKTKYSHYGLNQTTILTT